MEIYLHYNQEEWGPYSDVEILGMIESREVSPNDLIWYDGLDDWEPISSIFEIEVPKRRLPNKRHYPTSGTEIVEAKPYHKNPAKHRVNRQNRSSENRTNNQQVIINQQTPNSNGLGTAGFVLALIGLFVAWIPFLGWLVWFLGFIFSLIGVFKPPRGFAITGLVISSIGIIILILILGAFAAAASALETL